MTYKQTMRLRCACGKYPVGVWIGDDKTGHVALLRVSGGVQVGDLIRGDDHTLDFCARPTVFAKRANANLPVR